MGGKKAGLALLCDSLANELIVALDFTVRNAPMLMCLPSKI